MDAERKPGRKTKVPPREAITIREVAQAAGVSVGSVSRVLNGSPNVSSGLKRRVDQTMESLGFVPNVFARGMKGGTTQIIGILLRDITNRALASFVRAAEHELEADGYVVLVGCHDSLKERELKLLNVLTRRHVDGIIMTTSSEDDRELVQMRESLRLPVVLHDREVPRTWDSVRVNYRDATKRATEYLLALGHKRIGVATGSLAVYTARERVAGFTAAMNAAGVPIDPDLVSAKSFDARNNYADISGLLSRQNRPSALILGAIDMLAPALQAIHDHRLVIPKDISLIAGIDSDLARLTNPPITVLSWDYPELGRECARLLLERLHTDDVIRPRSLIYPAELVIRASCAPPPPGDAVR